MVNLELLLPLLITALITLMGWFIGHWLSARRDRANKLRDLRIQYLIEAWRRLEGASNRADLSRHREIESAIADIQLFGSQRQIELANKFVTEFAETRTGSTQPMLEELRKELRKNLDLPQTIGTSVILRIEVPEQQGKGKLKV